MFEIFAAIVIALIVAGSTGCATKKVLMFNCENIGSLEDKEAFKCDEP